MPRQLLEFAVDYELGHRRGARDAIAKGCHTLVLDELIGVEAFRARQNGCAARRAKADGCGTDRRGPACLLAIQLDANLPRTSGRQDIQVLRAYRGSAGSNGTSDAHLMQ